MDKPHIIYFAQAGNTPFVKIGHTRDLYSRLSVLQTGNPHTIKVLLTLEGDRRMESNLHCYFGKYRYRGEWFHLSPQIESFIAGGQKDAFDVDAYLERMENDKEAEWLKEVEKLATRPRLPQKAVTFRSSVNLTRLNGPGEA